MTPLTQPTVTTKAQKSQDAGSVKRQSAGSRLNGAKESGLLQLSSSTSQFLNRTMNRDGDDLNIRYVTDIDSIRQEHL